jgi:putative ABC transport system substrate-binding protein
MAIHIRRRQFIVTLGSAAAWLLAAHAQAARMPTVGVLGGATAATWSHWVPAFIRRLNELGWSEGRTIAIEYRWAEGSGERAAEFAAEFVRLKVDVILTAGGVLAAVKPVTSVIPNVFAVATDPVGPASPRVWRDRAAISLACPSRRPIMLQSVSNSSASFCLLPAGWPS